jgi:hypothetical protein
MPVQISKIENALSIDIAGAARVPRFAAGTGGRVDFGSATVSFSDSY